MGIFSLAKIDPGDDYCVTGNPDLTGSEPTQQYLSSKSGSRINLLFAVLFCLNLLYRQLLRGCQSIGSRHFHIRFHAGCGGRAAQEPWKFYDLGHGYRTYDFFDQCPHRMACAKCSFYLPKHSSQMQRCNCWRAERTCCSSAKRYP